jgi:hypothetical protein
MKVTPKLTWIQRTQAQRPTVAPRANKSATSAQQKPIESKVSAQLLAVKIPEKVAAEHGPALKAAMRDAAKLAALPVEPWRARQLERALEQLYKILGKSLSATPEADRADYAKRALKAFVALADNCGTNDQLMPCLYAATGLVDSGNRLREKDRVKGTPNIEVATAAVDQLRTTLAGRTGVGSALNVYANLVEQVERAEPKLTQARREKIFADVSKFLATTMPLTGFDQAAAAKLSAAVEKNGADLQLARAEFLAEFAPAHQQALENHRAQPNIPVIDKALEKILNANPSGPEALHASIDQFRATIINQFAGRGDLESVWIAIAKILDRSAQSSAAKPLLDLLVQLVPNITYRLETLAHLEAGAVAGDLAHIGAALLQAQAAVYGHNAPDNGILDTLTGLPDPSTALNVAVALATQLPNINPADDMMRETIELAIHARPEDPAKYFNSFASRYIQVINNIGFNQNGPENAAKIAAKTTGDNFEGNYLYSLGQAVNQIQGYFQQADIGKFLDPAGDLPGLFALVDPAIRYRSEPTNLLSQLAPYAQYQGEEAARFAIALAAKLGQLDGDVNLPLGRVQADLSAAYQNPQALNFAARGQSAIAVRAQHQEKTVANFIAAHPELPLEMALTAGIYCSPEQLTWFITKITETKARDTVRSLRDLLFACVQLGRMDAIDVVRNSASTAKATQAVITHIGREYRANRVYEIQLDNLLQGLRDGADPMGDAAQQKLEGGIQGIDLDALAGPKPSPEGMAMIARCAVALSHCFEYYHQQTRQPSGSDSQLDHSRCIAPLENVVQDVARGTWPKVKYENEVGVRLLKMLTPAQQKAWRQEMVTTSANNAPIVLDESMGKMVALMRGLAKAIPQELPKLDSREKALSALVKKRDTLLTKLRDAEKGTPEHKALGAEIVKVSQPLAVIELVQSLASTFENNANVDPSAAMNALRDKLQDAQAALLALGAQGSKRAAAEILFLGQGIEANTARQGHYAIDEDSLDALIQSHTRTSGSCLNHVDGFRKWGLSGAAADANIRMLRVYNEEKFGYRAFLKVFPVEFPGYQGPALWIDSPMAEGPVQGDDLRLLYENAIKKARAMGIPVMGPDGNLTNEGQRLGLANSSQNVTFHIDEGNTGLQHSDTLFGGAGNIVAHRGENEFYDVQHHAYIVMPQPA